MPAMDSPQTIDMGDAHGWFYVVLLLLYTMPFWGLLLTWLIGRSVERNHLRELVEREVRSQGRVALTGKHIPGERAVASSELAVGSVVVSVDYFKRWLSSFRMIFGGEMRSYASVVSRGRREALLRMKEACPDADMFINCRLETSTISNGKGKAVGCAEVFAYGTAVKFEQS